MLGEFAGKHPQRVQAIYLLTGGAGDGGVHTVRLVSQEKLEGVRSACDTGKPCWREAIGRLAFVRKRSRDASRILLLLCRASLAPQTPSVR